MGPVAARRLAVAADPVAGDRQQQRGDAKGLQRRRVDDETRSETGSGAEDRPAEQRHADQGHQHEVGRAVEDVDLREQRHLDDRGDEEHGRPFRDVGDHRFFGISTTSELNVLKFTNGCSWTCL